jgi:hypothetical protein
MYRASDSNTDQCGAAQAPTIINVRYHCLSQSMRVRSRADSEHAFFGTKIFQQSAHVWCMSRPPLSREHGAETFVKQLPSFVIIVLIV